MDVIMKVPPRKWIVIREASPKFYVHAEISDSVSAAFNKR